MKMVKSLLLGSAAGFVAVAGAQAADLPVKAKAAEYVKICSLYGKGFYYIPGSDTCLSITGFTRFQIYAGVGGQGTAPSSAGAGGSATNGYQQLNDTTSPFGAPNGYGTRAAGYQNDLTYRARVMLTVDARQQTQYGTLRSVVTAGYTNDVQSGGNAGTGIYANRGFIQIAGFTFGKAVSFYDSYCSPCASYWGLPITSDTGDGGKMVLAYTAQFGGGASATLSAEEPRRASIINVNATTGNLVTSAAGGNDPVNFRQPDYVAALRLDQTWGSFQVMGALHDASGAYYGANTLGQQNNGHPSDAWGWIVGAGLKLRFGADVFDIQGGYTNGALAYFNGSAVGLGGYKLQSQNVGYGISSDGVYGTGTSVDLTTAWGVTASYDHRWSPALKTSAYGGYMETSYNAEANGLLCTASVANSGISTTVGCNENFQQWYAGTRTQWDVARGFYVGLDLLYSKLQTANGGMNTTGAFTPVANGPRPAGTYAITDQSAWAITFRAHRDIVP